MAKSEQTKQLEQQIWKATHSMGVFGCFEVTMGWYGKERVDFMTYDTENTFRCYEIKVSVSDFRSKNHNTFVGHLNYYVMPTELYDKVKNEIPKGIGVFTSNGHSCSCEKRATRRELAYDEQILKNSLIRSLCREVNKQVMSENEPYIQSLKRELEYAERNLRAAHDRYWELQRQVEELYGVNWRHSKGCK